MISQRAHKRTDSPRRSVGPLFTRPPFQENHLLGIALVLHGTSIPPLSLFPDPFFRIDSTGIYEQQHNSRQWDWLLLPQDGCSSKSRAWFSFPFSTHFLSLSFIIVKEFSRCWLNVNRENSRAFICQTINCTSINPHYELSQVTVVIKSILCTKYNQNDVSCSWGWIRLIFVRTNIFSPICLPLNSFYTTCLQFLLLVLFSSFFTILVNYKSQYRSFVLCNVIYRNYLTNKCAYVYFAKCYYIPWHVARY